jgi:hypothetical protein
MTTTPPDTIVVATFGNVRKWEIHYTGTGARFEARGGADRRRVPFDAPDCAKVLSRPLANPEAQDGARAVLIWLAQDALTASTRR